MITVRTSVRNRRNWWEDILSFPFLFFIWWNQVRGQQAVRTSVANASTVYKRRPSSGLSRPLFPRWILIIPLEVTPALAASGPDTREPASSYLSQLVIPTADYPDSWVTMPVNDRSRGNKNAVASSYMQLCANNAANNSCGSSSRYYLFLGVPRSYFKYKLIVEGRAANESAARYLVRNKITIAIIFKVTLL